MFFGRKKKAKPSGRERSRPIRTEQVDFQSLPHEMARDIAKQLGRRIIIAGVCWGAEAHKMLLDPLFTLKGYLGDPGLEAYAGFEVMQIKPSEQADDLIRACVETKADVVVVARVAASSEVLASDLKSFVEGLNRAGGAQHKFIKIAISPKLTNEEARAVGFEAGFGTGTLPSQLIGVIDR
jgi:beta-lysine 5,6-aminomutase beta subunit